MRVDWHLNINNIDIPKPQEPNYDETINAAIAPISIQANYTSGADEKIIGVTDGRMIVRPSTLTKNTDFTSYGDRCVFSLTNSTGSAIKWSGGAIVGKPIIQHSNHNGYFWEYSDYDSIEKNGESNAEIGNDYIFTVDQVESIGDYWSKELKPHYVYTLSYPGCRYNLRPGDVWHLTLSYTAPGGSSESELIDTDVEIIGSSYSRQVGGIGETLIDVRVPTGQWTKTTSRKARLISSAKSQWLPNRSNQITIGASDWTGQATSVCDGTADDVQIQEAIDTISAAGGGEVVLSAGTFTIAATLTMKDNVWLYGSGAGTIIRPVSNSVTTMVDWGVSDTAQNAKLSDSVFAADSITGAFTMYVLRGRGVGMASSVWVRNYSAYPHIFAFTGFVSVLSCSVTGCSATSSLRCYYECQNIIDGVASNNSAQVFFAGAQDCKNITGCRIEYNSAENESSGVALWGIAESSNISNCVVANNSATGPVSYIYSFNQCANVSSCISQTNAASGASSALESFRSIVRLGFSETSGNAAGGDCWGFSNCHSVQQCKSSGDDTAYFLSYADSGTANACNDTSAGGYNS